MKILGLILACTALAGAAVTTTSCQGIFTKDDAKQIGAQIAQDSLQLAAMELNNEPINIKQEVAAIGFKAAASALGKVAANVFAAPAPAASPAATIASAASVAQAQIQAASVSDPGVKDRALELAADAVDTARAQVQVAASAPPTAEATSGK